MIDQAISRVWPALVIALGSVIAGGLLSAVTAHAATQAASWASAYLVLVGGVGTAGLAIGRGLLSASTPSRGRLWGELGLWMAGNALVMLGTLASPAWLVELGSVMLVAALGSVGAGVYRGKGHTPLRWLFLTLLVVLAVSIPAGILLSNLRR